MMCAKKVTMVMVLLVLVLASALAWPSGAISTKKDKEVAVSQELVEEMKVEETKVEETVEEVKPVKESKTATSFSPVTGLQTAVSTAQEIASSKLSNNKKLEELESALDDIEVGIDAMSAAYNDLAGLHFTLMPTVGYTIGKDVSNAFDLGFTGLLSDGHWYATLGVNKAIDFKNFKGNFKTFNDTRVSAGFGWKIF